MPPIWAFLLGTASQQLGLTYEPLVNAARFIGLANIPVILFVLGMTIPWRNLKPRPEILVVAGIKLLMMPLIVWLVAPQIFDHIGEAQYAAVALATTPSMMTALLLANRFGLDDAAAALLIGWSTILFWITLPLISLQPSEFLKPFFAVAAGWLIAEGRRTATTRPHRRRHA